MLVYWNGLNFAFYSLVFWHTKIIDNINNRNRILQFFRLILGMRTEDLKNKIHFQQAKSGRIFLLKSLILKIFHEPNQSYSDLTLPDETKSFQTKLC